MRPLPKPTPEDREDIEATLAHLLPKVRTWLHRALGPGAQLDDATQDALIEITRALPRFRGDSSLETFAYRITYRVAGHALRRRRNDVSLELVSPPPDHIDPVSRLAHRELLRALYRALDGLSTKRRLVFTLCDIEGMSPTEAAVILGSRANTVRSRLRRARNELHEILGADSALEFLRGEL